MNMKDMLPNMNLDTGIHYGCISQNSLNMDHMDDWYDDDACYDEIKQEIVDGVTSALSDYLDPIDVQNIVDEAVGKFAENYQNDEPQFYYEDENYSAQYSQSLCCWIISKSPYYTYCKGCSPCIPNAGDLDTPVNPDDYVSDMSVKRTYCLPKEFFDGEVAPYEYFEVNDR